MEIYVDVRQKSFYYITHTRPPQQNHLFFMSVSVVLQLDFKAVVTSYGHERSWT